MNIFKCVDPAFKTFLNTNTTMIGTPESNPCWIINWCVVVIVLELSKPYYKHYLSLMLTLRHTGTTHTNVCKVTCTSMLAYTVMQHVHTCKPCTLAFYTSTGNLHRPACRMLQSCFHMHAVNLTQHTTVEAITLTHILTQT